MVPLDGLSLQVERIIACVAAELVATHQRPAGQTKFVKRVAKKLTAILATYLAGEVASMLSPVAAIEHREMVAPLYQPLLTPVFWARPIYTELLHAASRLKKDTRIETARPSNGLVKIMCSPKALGEEPANATAGLYRQLFLHRNSSTTDGVYRGNDPNKWAEWRHHRALLWASQSAQPPQMALRMPSWILWGQTNYRAYLEWLDNLEQQQTQSGRFKTKNGYWRVKRRPQT